MSVAEGHAWGGSVTLPFLHDIEAARRLLLALPLLILAELVVHQRMRPVVRQFLERGLIPDAARAQFDAAIASACACAIRRGGGAADRLRLRRRAWDSSGGRRSRST